MALFLRILSQSANTEGTAAKFVSSACAHERLNHIRAFSLSTPSRDAYSSLPKGGLLSEWGAAGTEIPRSQIPRSQIRRSQNRLCRHVHERTCAKCKRSQCSQRIAAVAPDVAAEQTLILATHHAHPCRCGFRQSAGGAIDSPVSIQGTRSERR